MKKFLIVILGLLSTFLVACNSKEYLIQTMRLDPAFTITPQIRIIDTKRKLSKSPNLRDELSEITNKLDDVFNPNKNTSTLAKINQAAGINPVSVSDEVIMVIKEALRVSEETLVESDEDVVALYDITILPVWEKWEFGTKFYIPIADIEGNNRETIPSNEEIEEKLHLVDYRKVIINEETKTVFLTQEGMKIDLGSIVKGYACDKIKSYLLSQGFTRAIIDVGGNIMTVGYNYHEGLDYEWTFKIQTPYVSENDIIFDTELRYIGKYNDSSITVVTSGVYARYIKTEDDSEYHHILDPRTGYPINSGLLAVTIITDISMSADAYSTAVFSLGLSKGMALVNQREQIKAVFITVDKEIYISPNLEGKFFFNENISELGYIYKGVYNETKD